MSVPDWLRSRLPEIATFGSVAFLLAVLATGFADFGSGLYGFLLVGGMLCFLAYRLARVFYRLDATSSKPAHQTLPRPRSRSERRSQELLVEALGEQFAEMLKDQRTFMRTVLELNESTARDPESVRVMDGSEVADLLRSVVSTLDSIRYELMRLQPEDSPPRSSIDLRESDESRPSRDW